MTLHLIQPKRLLRKLKSVVHLFDLLILISEVMISQPKYAKDICTAVVLQLQQRYEEYFFLIQL